MNKKINIYLSIKCLSIQQYSIKICKISEWKILFHVYQKLTSKKKKNSNNTDLIIIKSIRIYMYKLKIYVLFEQTR